MCTVFKDKPFTIKFREIEASGPIAREAIDTFKSVDLPGTEAWPYPRRSLTYDYKAKEWVGLNTLGQGDTTLVAIPLRDRLQDSNVIDFSEDESKVASFMWYHCDKHISEAKAVAIDDEFDVSTYAADNVTNTGPPKARKRSFDPAPPGPSTSTAQRDLNCLLDEGTSEANDSAALLFLGTEQSKRSKP